MYWKKATLIALLECPAWVNKIFEKRRKELASWRLSRIAVAVAVAVMN